MTPDQQRIEEIRETLYACPSLENIYADARCILRQLDAALGREKKLIEYGDHRSRCRGDDEFCTCGWLEIKAKGLVEQQEGGG